MDTSNKHIWQITYPILLTLLAQNIVNVTDTAFLGHVGEVELGASAIAGIFYIAVYMVGFGFSQGSQILIGRRNGEKRYHEIGKIFNNGLMFNFMMAIVIFIAAQFLMSPILSVVIKSANIFEASMSYLGWRVFGFFFSFVNVMFRALYVGITKTKVLSVSAVITATVNVVFDYLLIFGNYGFPQMGIEGAGLASLLAEIATSLYLFGYTLFKTDIKKYGLFSFLKIDFQVIKKTLELSIFMMFQYFISVSTWFLFFIFIERTGERPLAVSNIVRSFYTILMIPANALGTTTSTMVSNMIGAGKSDEVMKTVSRLIKINALVAIPFVFITLVFPELFVKIYTTDPSLLADTIPVVRLISFSLLIFGTGIIMFNSVSATGNTRIAFVFELIVLIFYLSYTYLTTVVYPSEVAVVWIAEYIYWSLIGLMSFIYLKSNHWKRLKI